ncbi:CBASS cGAMP-activated phospholipase [Evansella halocellulosilytica]|uniref:CBASS cGAMP-activated phospholipase n=1 Tax=Evansella halocellulosilytica TaxID=2011013 RepID=UPI000BB7F86F|nr:CBASS cGAMP-activated phospholipase [Evansella halocellulosilytica]
MKELEPYKILSIDGGGIKGLYSAVILSDFEEKYGKLNNYFDLICGTSTGGIIALALSAGIPAKEIVSLYEKNGPKIFPYNTKYTRLFHKIKQALFTSKYSDSNLRLALVNVFGEKRIRDCKTNVLIPTSNITRGTPCIIKTDHHDELGRDSNHLLVDVALATAAAPTYFPIQEISTMEHNNDQFADGGLFANNPSLHGIQEAYRYFIGKSNYKYGNFSLLSISTLHQNFSYQKPLKIRRRSFVQWNVKLISLMMDLQSISTHYHIEYLNKSLNGNYVRIGSEPLTNEESKKIDLDKASNDSIVLLKQKGHEASRKWIEEPELLHFFDNDIEKINNRGEAVGTM